MVVTANERFDSVGNLTDEETREYVRRLAQSLVDWTRRIGSKEEADGDESPIIKEGPGNACLARPAASPSLQRRPK